MLQRRPSPDCRAAFSLMELLVVSSIISIMVALLVPALKGVRDKARAAQCTSNMRQFGYAFQMYMDQNNGMMPASWVDGSDNWESRIFDKGHGGTYLDSNNGLRSFLPGAGWPDNIRASVKILCPATVNAAKIGPDGSVIKLTDPHDQWGYTYNSLRCDISTASAGGAWPWNDGRLMGTDQRAYYRQPARYIVMCDGNGTNWQPYDDWDATTGDFTQYIYPVQPVHTEGINSLFLDGHVQYMSLRTANDRLIFNRAFYGGIPIGGNPYIND